MLDGLKQDSLQEWRLLAGQNVTLYLTSPK
jgi:hypothetical protein